ncbi:MAG: metalloregulator ArsR/SmtB family transcription factor [Oscillospiraceae bacterium]
MSYADYVLIFKALADETRLKIVSMLSEGELCACKILESFSITQPTLSYHMKILCDSGLVESKRDGAWLRYSLNSESFRKTRDLVIDITTTIDNNSSIDNSECNNDCLGDDK